MSDPVKHECGIALIRLRKPFSYYLKKYGPLYPLKKLYILMEKQHNRGQDGAGISTIKLNVPPGISYIDRSRSVDNQPIQDIFKKVNKKHKKAFKKNPDKINNSKWIKDNLDFTGEVLMGHLRYGTFSENNIKNCHPFVRSNNWKSRTLVLAGNFNMTNNDELFQKLIELGQHPREKTDTVTVMEKIGHFLDEENNMIFEKYKDQYSNKEMSPVIEDNINIQRVLERSCKDFDGGYAMTGITGYGEAFAARDPNGIRPAYYYADDEFVVVASEKPAIKIAFNAEYSEIKEIKPGNTLIIHKNGDYSEREFIKPQEKTSCTFERIYFSRGTDPDIYNERKNLGKFLTNSVLQAINYDLENTVFSYIPNTAELAYLGLIREMEQYLIDNRIKNLHKKDLNKEQLEKILSYRPRVEKLVIKDAKLRTFITNDNDRDDLVTHVYDTTYEVIKKHKDTLVILDDSIVRGTTLEKSILRMLDSLEPKRVIIVSSAPQIRFPDCYGIDMSKMGEFVAFRAVIQLLKDYNMNYVIDDVYRKCKSALKSGKSENVNYVKELYSYFSYEDISKKIAQIITPKNMNATVDVIYQSVEDLHKACPDHKGDWYFTGNYPTPGGNKIANQSYVNYIEGNITRAYQLFSEA